MSPIAKAILISVIIGLLVIVSIVRSFGDLPQFNEAFDQASRRMGKVGLIMVVLGVLVLVGMTWIAGFY